MPYQAGSSAQRIRIGLTGLAFAFLLVLLGSIISRSSTSENANNAAQQAASNEPSEPLAELGVAPGASDQQHRQRKRNDPRADARAGDRAAGRDRVAAGLAYAVAQRQLARLRAACSGRRPTLLLLTSLPLVFGEQFSIKGGGSPALKALETRYRVVPISVADQAELARGRLLLMAHPRAQPAEDLVALDQWVRGGGRVLLLADPMLEWPSDRPLGDPLRPPPMFWTPGCSPIGA